MIALLVLAAVLSWYIIGVGGFVYWWTSDYDLGGAELLLAGILGIAGPFTWPMGWAIHGDHSSRVFVKKRGGS